MLLKRTDWITLTPHSPPHVLIPSPFYIVSVGQQRSKVPRVVFILPLSLPSPLTGGALIIQELLGSLVDERLKVVMSVSIELHAVWFEI